MEMTFPLLRFIKRINKKYVAILILATIALSIRILLFPEFGWQLQFTLFFISICSITFIWTVLEYIDVTLNRYLPYEQGVVRRIVVQIVIGLVFLYLILSLLVFFFLDFFPFQVDKIQRLLAYVIATLMILTVNGGSVGTYFFKEWKKALIKSERLQKERAVVQFENLKNQLNPHFLFNSLTSLNSLIFENQQLASQFLQQLSKVFRYVLQNKEKELVSLETEIHFIENYISLLQTRFCNCLHIHINISKANNSRYIVPVTLQILIENAIKHNIVNEQNPLTIQIYADEAYLYVQNNLQLKSIIENSNKMGLENMKALYEFLSENVIEVIETDRDFTVKIPLL
jgi:sensor histidine kinase YesM